MKELESIIKDTTLPLFDEFIKWGCEMSPTFKYWQMFLDCAQVMLSNIRAEREGNWVEHLETTVSMVPLFFSVNRVNYARWTPVYILDMLNLPDNVRIAFEGGEFTVRKTASSFNGIWSDMGVETTIIKDAKGQGGIVGITRKKPALVRWSVTRHIISQYASVMKDRTKPTNTEQENNHKEVFNRM